jgi:hypothetical protein
MYGLPYQGISRYYTWINRCCGSSASTHESLPQEMSSSTDPQYVERAHSATERTTKQPEPSEHDHGYEHEYEQVASGKEHEQNAELRD